ncbi:MAG: 16S rRNA processing protein RimM [Armatimonadetes bacterium]|nr:16S rRNA processing protein RimM [Armatimonadota bacterium]
MDEEYPVLAAQVVGAHGVGGNVRLRLVGADPAAAARSLQAGLAVRLVRPDAGARRDLTLTSLRRQGAPKGAWLAHFREITDRTAAEEIVGWSVRIPEAARAPLPEGEYYVDELVGLEVVTDAGRSLGQLADVLHSPANDVYETDRGVLIPAVAAFILGIDRAAGRITVRDVPGLADEP